LNAYGYVDGNPLNYYDSQGLHKGDKWYGRTNREFQRWFHQCWKQPGDPDANKEEIEEAYAEWQRRGSPEKGKCDGTPPPPVPVAVPAPSTSESSCGDTCERNWALVFITGIGYVLMNVCTLGMAGS